MHILPSNTIATKIEDNITKNIRKARFHNLDIITRHSNRVPLDKTFATELPAANLLICNT
jgi:hypothetical protein